MLTFKMKNTRFLVYVTFLFFILLVGIDATKSHKNKHKKHAPPPPQSSYGSGSKTFNVMDYGARGDGRTDDTEAFSNAWEEACRDENPVVLVPSPGVFGVKQVSFSGDCKSKMVFQLDGTIVAPASRDAYDSGLLQWLEFTKLQFGLTIRGRGTIEGNGEAWWSEHGGTKPTALRVADIDGVIVKGITIQNSQQTHLKFDNCDGVEVSEITVSSPGDSPNTDGIHLQNSQNVYIHDIKVACGDDCVSIQTGSSGIKISNILCGPSHGISIGSLGKDGSSACVKNVTVTDCTITKSDNGLRIKTWPGGRGSVSGVSFSNIHVSEVDNAMVINQYYCDGGCSQESGAVSVSDVSFNGIFGSYGNYPASFDCSSEVPCEGLTLSDINLKPLENAYDAPSCVHAFGSVDDTKKCLNRDGPSSSSPFYYSNKQDSSDNNGGTC